MEAARGDLDEDGWLPAVGLNGVVALPGVRAAGRHAVGPDALRTALLTGIGPAKGDGQDLLTLAPFPAEAAHSPEHRTNNKGTQLNLRSLVKNRNERENHASAEAVPVETRTSSLSRRGVLAASAGVLLAAGCTNGEQQNGDRSGKGDTAEELTGILGANFNEHAESVTFDELRGLSASWLRGFVPMPDVTDDASRQRAIKKLTDAHDQGYGTVLSLKFPFHHQPIPLPDSPAMTAELARVDKVLRAVLDTVDVLAIGNEPFLESRRQDIGSGAMNTFYETIAAHVIAYRKKHFPSVCRTRLYMGALNRIDRLDKRTKATARWLSFTRRTPEIEGVDIHPHVTAVEHSQAFLDYILPRLRKDQKFLVTEFSLVHVWKQHLKDTIPADFARLYDVPPDTPVWKAIREAIERPVPEEQWHDFLAMSPWYENNRHFLRDQMRRFRDTGRLAVATYGVAQSKEMTRNFGPEKSPWLLNSLYAKLTAEPSQGDLPARNYGVFDDFRALQRKEDRRPVQTPKTAT
ncbi:hypothetical protein [Streptomyces sp. GESEQ-35]|uniref:hypothetical protein n=1 Tax=Streptomyces sp. GESEQ-35 TaxID=2812657 RepID=UPI001FF563C0|nr:hypothetical protein [Streptomyces sp. GESEQ-35]